ncbi:MAG TPA: hypothetical protein VNX65_04775 [Patescibacteria group bacterium]|jgi:hypothetical protein|nr:hypothetical protein [Patescibacteria group bacterium]
MSQFERGSDSNLRDLESLVLQLGPVAQQSVVVGSWALKATIGGQAEPHDIDIAFEEEEAFRYLRLQPGWAETQFPDGRPRLTKDGYDIGVDWGKGFSAVELRRRGWRTSQGPQGIAIAGLSDIYAWNQQRAVDLDDPKALQSSGTLSLIRDELIEAPLLPRVMPREVEFTRDCLPERFRDDPDTQLAIQLAANGLHMVRVLYGDETAGRANLLSGELELPEYYGRTYYHQGSHTADGMRRGQIHMSKLNAIDIADGRTPRFDIGLRLDALMGYSNHDGILGNGRESDNPTRYDELESAKLSDRHLAIAGLAPEERRRGVYDAVMDTGFNQQTGSQKGGGEGRSDLGRTTAGVDLQGIVEALALADATKVILEDMAAGRQERVYGRILGKVAKEHGVVLGPDFMDALAFIDQHPDARPSDDPSGPTLKQALAKGYIGNAGFVDPLTGYQFPRDWTGDVLEMRIDHADKSRELGGQLSEDEIGAVEAYAKIQQHTLDMREKYSDTFDSILIESLSE